MPGVTLDENKNIVSYNIEEEQWRNFCGMIVLLEASGSSWENLIDITVYLTNMKDDFPAFNRIYADLFSRSVHTTLPHYGGGKRFTNANSH
ncbi:MAG: Rid family hydrolase [Cytophagales bacterium]|nr:Rid family hydrolase [Cytophagales bacterium]